MIDKKRIFSMTRAKAYALSCPETPEPFTMREFLADAWTHGYEAAMKDGLQHIIERIDAVENARFLALECEDER